MKAKAEKYKDHKPVHFGYLAKVLWDVAEELYGGKNRVVIDARNEKTTCHRPDG